MNREREVLLPDDREEHEHPVGADAVALRGEVRAQHGHDRDDLGMERLPREPLHRRLQQPHERRHERRPRAREPIACEQVDRHGAEREHDDLEQVDELRSGTEPVEGDEEEVPERRVVPEDREPADGREPMAA